MICDGLQQMYQLVNGAVSKAEGEDQARREALAQRLRASIRIIEQIDG